MLKRINSSVKPLVFENLGNGNWYYNYDIQVDETTGQVMYNYILVKLPELPDYKKCVEAIIGEYITLSLEFDLINSYNRILLGLLEDNGEVDKYMTYLNLVLEIKDNVRKDFK